MKTLVVWAVSLLSLALIAESVEAAQRMGRGANRGIQRSAPAPQKAAPVAPAQKQQAAPGQQQPQPSGLSKWLGPLAGLALGAGLAALFLNNGLGGMLAGLLVIGLLVAALVFAARFLMRGRSAPSEPLQYAGAGAGTAGPAPMDPGTLAGGAGAQSVAATTSRWPAGFNEAEFVRQARLNFVRLQEANDKRDLSTMRDFLTRDLYLEIEADLRTADAAPQRTEVLTLDAQVLEVVEEDGHYIVSVQFSGMIREGAGREPEAFTETWHLQKPVNGSQGWLIAGIQQA